MVDRAFRGHKRALGGGLATVVVYALLSAVVTGPGQTPLFLAGYALAWLFYLALLRDDAILSAPIVLAGSLVLRLLWVGSEPWLSDDLYRYLLDGRVLLEGINPFRYAPEHPQIQALSPALAGRVNHPQVPTIYPAVVQLAAAFAAMLELGAVGWRVLVSLVDVGLVAAVSRLFGGGRAGWRAAAVYGLCPLAVVESAANGHVEPLVLLPLVLAVTPAINAWRTGAWVGIAALAKYFPLVLLPYWLSRARGWRVASVAVAVLLAGMLPFAIGGVDISVGLRTYLEHWSFNGPVFALLNGIFGDAPWLRALPFAVAMAVAWLAGRRGLPGPRALSLALASFLICGPTLHPWYALWLLPFLGPRPDRTLWAFVFAMGLSYAVWWQQHTRGEWMLPLWQAAAIWSLVLLAWLWPRLSSGGQSSSRPA